VPKLEPRAVLVLGLGLLAFVVPILPAIAALGLSGTARRKTRGSHGRRSGDKLITAGIVLAVVSLVATALLAVGLFVVFRHDIARSLFVRTYLNWKFLTDSFPAVRRGFWVNVRLFMVAEVVVLAWGLIVAVVRGLPGPAAAPLRWVAIAYIDVFRGLPALLTIYLIGFGAPIAHVPWLGNQSLFVRGTVALTLVYGAYVAEVYRAGIESVHWSQRAAARSLGLSSWQTMVHVVLPQAVRRVVPPLMNDFIGLQKDTSLLNVIGVNEGFRVATTYAGVKFNPSSIVGLGACFVLITIPMTRLTDYLLLRSGAKMRAEGRA
jgi:polar amino acid transport system permease protein